MGKTQPESKDDYPSPRLFMFLVAASIFTIETALMFLLGKGRLAETWSLGILDSFLLTLILLPALYYLMYRPFKAQIGKRSQMALQAKMNNELLAVIVEAQQEFIARGTEDALFDKMLERFVVLTRSARGCLMEVRPEAEGMDLFVRSVAGERGRNVLRERVIAEEVVIKGGPVAVSSNAGGPDACLGIPLYSEGRIIGVISVSGRKDAYGSEVVELMSPFVNTCAGLLEAYRAEGYRARNEERLKAARDQAEEALRIKDRFVSLVAHDLKEPLAAILLSLNYLQRDREAETPTYRGKLVGYMTKTTQELLRLVDELLVQGRIRMGKIAPRFADAYACAIVGVAMARVDALAAAKGVRLLNDVPNDLLLKCDPDLITEVVVNFLVNAVKFTPAGGSATVFAPEDGNAALAVRDTGVGLSRARIGELLTPGAFVSSKGTEGEKGTGFGIPLCVEILEAHGGQLRIESEEGKGSTFLFTLTPKRISITAV